MSNAFLQLPTPVSNGVGAAVDVTSLSSTKTVLIGGTFDAVVSLETSSDGGVTWGPATVSAQGPLFKTIELSATHMRVRISGLISGTPVVYVGSAVASTKAAVLDVPVGNGSGAPSDISGFADLLTLVVSGDFSGSLSIELSDDGTNWSPLAFFTGAGISVQSGFAMFMRVTRSGVGFNVNLPAVAVAASGDSDAPSTPGFVSPLEKITIYARLTGSDTVGNGTLADPYRTFQRAIRDVPMLVPPGVVYVVDITGIGVEVLPTNYALPPFATSGAQFLLFDDPQAFLTGAVTVRADLVIDSSIPAADATIDALDILSSVQNPTTGLRTITLTAPRASWGGDALKGKIITTGVGFNDMAVISASTTTTIDISTPVNPTAPIQINEQSATLSVTDDGLLVNNLDSICFVGINVESSNGGFSIFSTGSKNFIMSACRLGDLQVNGGVGDFFNTIFKSYVYNVLGFSVFQSTFQWTLVVIDGLTLLPAAGAGAMFFRFSTLDGCYIEPVMNSSFPLGATIPAFGMQGVQIKNAPDAGLIFYGTKAKLQNVAIDDSTGDAIRFIQGGGGLMELINVTGAGNGGLGVLVSDGGQVQADVDCTVTGAGGDFQVGTLAAGTWVLIGQNVVDPATFARLNQTA